MTNAIVHRGPDEEGLHVEPGVALGNRRLAIVDLEHGQQPMCNETHDVWVAYEGELYDPQLRRSELESRGHVLKTRCDTELWPHAYEDRGSGVFEWARGQFGVSIWDRRSRTLSLGRDRAGIVPLFYTEVDGWLLWCSEVKGLLASGLVEPKPDRLGLDYFFHTFVLGNSRTCFEGVHSLPPGHFLEVKDGRVTRRRYWQLDFPDAGDERRFADVEQAVDEYEGLLRGAVKRRLLADVPVCCYISGGLDSTVLLGLSSQENGTPLTAYTIGLDNSGPNDERGQAAESAGLVGAPLETVTMQSRDIALAYPELVRAAEGPVLDTSAGCTLRLAQAVRRGGHVVSLTGEGADEALAGYVWFKADRIVRATGRPLNAATRWFLFSQLAGRGNTHLPWKAVHGTRPAQQFTYELMAHSRRFLYSPGMWESVGDYRPLDELLLDGDRMRKWHPLNRSLAVASEVMLPGMLLAAKGDRAQKNASTEGRFPFLDESVVDFCATIDPRLKLRGFTDKYLLRRLAARVLPKQIARRPKTMFRANFSGTFLDPNRPEWVDQLLSDESLRATGYFDPEGVRQARDQQRASRRSFKRFVLDMGLTGAVATQLWHHTFFGGGLADLPTWDGGKSESSRPPQPTTVVTDRARERVRVEV